MGTENVVPTKPKLCAVGVMSVGEVSKQYNRVSAFIVDQNVEGKKNFIENFIF